MHRYTRALSRHTTALVTALACLALPLSAQASPWVLPEGVSLLNLTMGTQSAQEEFLPGGRRQRFPLRGRFDSYFFQLGGRHGLGQGLELSARALLKSVSFDADPILLLEEDPSQLTQEQLRASVFSFDRRAAGLADLYLGASHQHSNAALRLASTLEVKLPTGYDSPRETFLEGKPEEPGDDVTLGDAQVDLQYWLEAGYVWEETQTLVQAAVGYRARLQGPGDQITGQLKLGQSVTRRFFFYAGLNSAWTLFKGESIGTTLVAADPSVPAQDFTPENVRALDLTLDRSFLAVDAGAILRFEGRELVFNGTTTLLGTNYPVLTGFSVGTLLVFE